MVIHGQDVITNSPMEDVLVFILLHWPDAVVDIVAMDEVLIYKHKFAKASWTVAGRTAYNCDKMVHLIKDTVVHEFSTRHWIWEIL